MATFERIPSLRDLAKQTRQRSLTGLPIPRLDFSLADLGQVSGTLTQNPLTRTRGSGIKDLMRAGEIRRNLRKRIESILGGGVGGKQRQPNINFFT